MNAITGSIGPQVAFSEELHADKYRSKGETFREGANRVAAALADNPEHYQQIRAITLPMRFLFAGRVQVAMGSTRNITPYNCFVSGTIRDSFVHGEGSIMDRAKEAAATMRMGGGIGYDFSTLRPRGDLIKKLMSRSTGPVSFMEIFNSVCKCVASAGHRRGAMMGVLRVDHPDIEEFIHAKHNETALNGFNMSIGITDEFMRCVIEGKPFALTWGGIVYKMVDARALWETIMRSTWDWAEPGVIFIDTINKMNNLWYCETIAATNPCFTGDTKVWTEEGSKTFQELAESGKPVEVLTQLENGNLAFRTMNNPRVTQRDAELIEVQLDDGSKIRCTPNHRFFLKNGTEVEAKDLMAGDSVQSVYRYKANQKGYKRLTNGKHAPLEHHIPFGDVPKGFDVHHVNEIKDDNRRSNLQLLSSSEHRSMHMRGDRNPMRRFPEKNKSRNVDNSGENNGRYRKDIDDNILQSLRDTGLSYGAIAKKVGCCKFTVMKRLGWNHKVLKVTNIQVKEDVCCGSVDETNRFFIHCEEGGVLVHNCGEQPLPPFGACLLGSFNLVKYIFSDNAGGWVFDWAQFKKDIPNIVRALDNVVDNAIYPLPEQELEAQSKRRMGLGVTGLANCIEALGGPYGSPGFLALEDKIMAMLCHESYRASIQLAKEKGAFPLFDKEKYLQGEFIKTLPEDIQDGITEHGIRNSHLTSIAPTGTISFTADNVSSGIEPVFAYSFDRTIEEFGGQRTETVEDYGVRVLGIRGRRSNDVTVQEHLAVLATAQRYMDSSCAKTCNVGGDIEWEEFKQVYITAWETGCKGCTTYRADGKRKGVLVSKDDEVETGATCYIDPLTGRHECE